MWLTGVRSTFALGGRMALGIFVAAVNLPAVVRNVWLVLDMVALWIVSVSYLYFGLHFPSRFSERTPGVRNLAGAPCSR